MSEGLESIVQTSGVKPGKITVAEILERKTETLELELLTPEVRLDREATDSDISSPGLALAGFTARFPEGRMQVFGQTEMMYLASLEPGAAEALLRDLFGFEVPAVFVTKGQEVPEYFLRVANEMGRPVIRSHVSTKDFYHRLKPFLEHALAPHTHVHGSLADVYGVGLLFVGDSGVGKSECVLDLVERGHRLVADDLVVCSRQGLDVLIGKGHELQKHHMEIRGLGIVDIKALFGIRAIRHQKRVEVVVRLEYWDSMKGYDRTGLQQAETEILGVTLPWVTVPLNPGKNITVISEVVAMNHLLKYSGVDSSVLFNQHLQQTMMRPVKDYLEQDYE